MACIDTDTTFPFDRYPSREIEGVLKNRDAFPFLAFDTITTPRAFLVRIVARKARPALGTTVATYGGASDRYRAIVAGQETPRAPGHRAQVFHLAAFENIKVDGGLTAEHLSDALRPTLPFDDKLACATTAGFVCSGLNLSNGTDKESSHRQRRRHSKLSLNSGSSHRLSLVTMVLLFGY